MTLKEIKKQIESKGLKKSYLAKVLGVTAPELSQAINKHRDNDTCQKIIQGLIKYLNKK